MFVKLTFQVVAFLVFCQCALAAPLSRSDLVGTYSVDTSKTHGRPVPTNFMDFRLTLNSDGTFVAKSVPADFFFDTKVIPGTPEAKGTWHITHEAKIDSAAYNAGRDYLDLNFTSAPGPGSWSHLIHPSSSEPPWIEMNYHTGQDDHVFFLLKKEKR